MPNSDPTRARDYRREYSRGHRVRDERMPPVPLAFRLQTAADVLALLEEQVQAVRREPETGALEKARALGSLAAIALKAIEAGNLAARIEMLEAVLKQRNGDGPR